MNRKIKVYQVDAFAEDGNMILYQGTLILGEV